MNIGILGAGQLGRMLALAGYPLGLRFRFFDPASDPSAGPLAPTVQAQFTDRTALDCFRDGLDVVTYEFESVPVSAVRYLAQSVPVYPAAAALEVAQDRLAEKSLFARLGIATPSFAAIDSLVELQAALGQTGFPAVLKTRRGGYDGKGQAVLRKPGDVPAAWEALGAVPLILEQFVPFERELSLIAVRDRAGSVAFYPLAQNRHQEGMLRLSLAPAPGPTAELQRTAEDYAGRIIAAVDYVGVLAIEFFEHGGQLLANEIAPRVHNSGHWTIEGATTSQFENHLRAILGWPLGSTAAPGAAAMLNLIGSVPPVDQILAVPGAKLHWYGKEPFPQRKLGHITLWSPHGATEWQQSLAVLEDLIQTSHHHLQGNPR